MAIVEHFVRFIKNVAINQRNTTNLVQQIKSMVGLISHSVDVWGSLALVRLLFSPSDPCFFFFFLCYFYCLSIILVLICTFGLWNFPPVDSSAQ